MRAEDVTETLTLALEASGCDQAKGIHKPRLLSDNGSSYIPGDLADWLEDHGMKHVRGAPHYPQTQGKIERWHQTLKNRVLLENLYLPGDLKGQIGTFVDHYNPGFPRWIASLMTFLGGSAIRINAIPSSRRVKPVSPCG